MKRPTELLRVLCDELAQHLNVAAKRDVEEIQRRYEHEGMSFLTITLPAFCDGIELSLERGWCERESFPGFRALKHRCTPEFLRGFTRHLFDSDGVVRPDLDPYALFAVRQITRLFKKIKLPCTPSRVNKAIKSYKDVEATLKQNHASFERDDGMLDSVSRVLWHSVFPEITLEDMVCKHGPGATAEKRRSNERFELTQWYDRAEHSFPSDLHCIPNFGHYDELSKVNYLSVSEEQPVRVVFVPKTLKAPRVIAIEPSNVQYVQQAVMRYMTGCIERHPLTRGSVLFSDQSINQRAARDASITKKHATLDLSEASDRVSLALVQRIFRGSSILHYLEDSRSLSATLPNGDNLVLSKFASMGSATCFPVEACVFYTLIIKGVLEHLGKRPSVLNIMRISRDVKVYGDDIVVPCTWLQPVILSLESYGLKVNRAKTFSDSHFRESCGGDYYTGVDVKPTYIRVPIPVDNNWAAEELSSLCSTSNQFYMNGLWSTCRLLRDWMKSFPIPVLSSKEIDITDRDRREILLVGGDVDVCYKSVIPQFPMKKWSKDLQQPVCRILSVRLKAKEDDITHSLSASLMKALPVIGIADHVLCLTSSGRSGALTLKRRWMPMTKAWLD